MIFLGIFLLLFGADQRQALTASLEPDMREKSIIIQYFDDSSEATKATALIGRHEVLIPVAIMQEYIIHDSQLDKAAGRLYWQMPNPTFQMETAVLDKLVQSGAMLNFSLTQHRGKWYINVDGLETILGIKLKAADDDGSLVVRIEPKLGNDSSIRLNEPRIKQPFNGKINLVWDYVRGSTSSKFSEKAITGLDVISPTWFSVVSEAGLVENHANVQYVRDAHEKKYKVWALLNNSFDSTLTHQILENEAAQQNIVKQVVLYASMYNLDGINIDFENIDNADKNRLTEFVRLLRDALKEQNIAVSMDFTVPSSSLNWSACYDRQKLAAMLDYCMVMTYDEHSRLSQTSGSVASLDWVDKGIVATLPFIPKAKLLIGIPFYTREWAENTVNGKITVTSKALSMAQANARVLEYHSPVVWLEDKGQFYTEYVENEQRYRIWLEDEKSVGLKAALVDKYNLAGVASWRKDFETPEIWNVLAAVLHKGSTIVRDSKTS
ncbi:MAG TPA: glycosyl hydrolase family 18 protein [Negativicutes bacterium]